MLLIRRVRGASMRPALSEGTVVLAWARPRRLAVGDVVILRHDDLEKIKRVHGLRDNQVFVLGDDPGASTDSRQFGWLPRELVLGRVWWPRLRRQR